MLYPFITALIVIGIDQYVKYLTVTHLQVYESAPGLDPFFDFYYLRNKGAGWGILENKMILFYIVTILVIIYLFYLIYQHQSDPWWFRLGLGLMLGGAVGNFIDRVRYQYVIDMIRLKFINFPIFNIADLALSLGLCLLIAHTVLEWSQEGGLSS